MRYSFRRVDIFFFQAEDGIRDRTVTGVQTCALPIYSGHERVPPFTVCGSQAIAAPSRRTQRCRAEPRARCRPLVIPPNAASPNERLIDEIGRASCRERVKIWVRAAFGDERSQPREWP